MVCQVCNNNAEYVKCAQCQTCLCQECATLYIVGNGCSTTPIFLCPECLKEYQE